VERHQESTSLTNKPRNQLPKLQVELRNPTDSDQEQLLSEKSEDSKSQLNSSSASFLSKDSSEKSLLSSRMTSDSNHLPSLLSKKPPSHTWSVSLKTLTSAPSTPRELPSCQRTCNWPEESEEKDLEVDLQYKSADSLIASSAESIFLNSLRIKYKHIDFKY